MQVSAKADGTVRTGLQPEIKRRKSEKVDQAAQKALPKAPAAVPKRRILKTLPEVTSGSS